MHRLLGGERVMGNFTFTAIDVERQTRTLLASARSASYVSAPAQSRISCHSWSILSNASTLRMSDSTALTRTR